jgi:hypothetical protein
MDSGEQPWELSLNLLLCSAEGLVGRWLQTRLRFLRYPVPTIEEMRKHLISYRDNMRVEVEQGIPVTAKTVADLRALSTWPDGLVLNIHVGLDPRLSVVMVERAP